MFHATPRLLFDRFSPRQGLLAAVAATLAIALLDELTGYALRLSTLYLLPIALAAWTAGKVGGFIAASLASLLWLPADMLGTGRAVQLGLGAGAITVTSLTAPGRISAGSTVALPEE